MTKRWGQAASIAPLAGAILVSGLGAGQARAQNECGDIVGGASTATIICNGIANDAGSDGSVNVTNASDGGDDSPIANGVGIDFSTLTTGTLGSLNSLTLQLDGSNAPLVIGNPSLPAGVTTNDSSSPGNIDFSLETKRAVVIRGGRTAINIGDPFYEGGGSVTVDTSAETQIESASTGSNGDGLSVIRNGGGDTSVTNASRITSTGSFATQNIIVQHNDGSGDIYITTTDASHLETTGTDQDDEGQHGILALQNPSDPAVAGDIFIEAGGTIQGPDAARTRGIWTLNLGGGATVIHSTADITNSGHDSQGVLGNVQGDNNSQGVKIQVAGGDINVSGVDSTGVYGFVDEDAPGDAVVEIIGGSVTASGNDSFGVVSWSQGGSSTLSINSDVTGGAGDGSGVFSGASSTETSTIEIGANGFIDAYSDFALTASGGASTLTNAGTILGVVSMTDQEDTFTNTSSNSWNIRNFSDTDADLIRDTEGVAVSDFGGGIDTYTNTATGALRLATVEDMSGFTAASDDDTAPITWDTTDEYSAPGSASVSITDAGIEQGHLINLEFFDHAGLISMADADTGGIDPVAGDVLLITGGSTAGTHDGGVFTSNGGQLHIDTVLNDGVVDTTDVLVVDNAVLGSAATDITVTNAVPGAGASTDQNNNGTFDPDEGILVVQARETGDAGAFSLAEPVVDGAWQYVLDQTDGQSWYLHSLVSSSSAVYEASPYVLLDGFTKMPTLEQRVGQRRWNSAAGTLEPTSGGWARVFGDWAEADIGSGTSYDANNRGLQAGFDLPVEPGEEGQWVLGLTAQTGNTSASITTATGSGNIEADSLGVGATATWYGHNDFYVDLQGQVNWASMDYASSLDSTLANGELARTVSASVEVGRRFALDENRGLIPQAQLYWASIDGGSFTDSAGNGVDLGTNERVTGRLGLAYDYEWRDEDRGAMQNVYGIVNILHDFSNGASVDVAGAALDSTRETTWGEIGLGGSMTWDDTRTLYGEVSYREALGDNGDGSGLSASAGLRIQW